ncbi:protein of unknown function [Oryzisolibacter propanilivorax]|uniref:DUF4124 domain-containing protein n=1 Tax=Oryzisolibacter propanilivorax TaxID=1527607 RepID=A0A1G9UNG3_9BURK|nr:DUF4124 domain-containing protein [Oryzisolibacter propanilivorax]SDM61439.1 protein of unknown function [Oryzisolibacter propanilivorax]
MQRKPLFLLVLACAWSLGASAQWQWIDKDGRKVFSDRPPPQEVPDKNILKQPSLPAAPARAVAPLVTDEASPAAPTLAPKPSGRDAQLEEKKARAEAAEAARKQAQDKAQAAQLARERADNCQRARQSSAALTSGTPLVHHNAQGERVFMDDAARAAELRRAQDIVASDCGPLPPAPAR